MWSPGQYSVTGNLYFPKLPTFNCLLSPDPGPGGGTAPRELLQRLLEHPGRHRGLLRPRRLPLRVRKQIDWIYIVVVRPLAPSLYILNFF